MRSKRTIPRVCEECGITFLVRPCDIRKNGARFCTRTCNLRYHTARRGPRLLLVRVVGEHGCWVPEVTPRRGYCYVWHQGKNERVHRLTYARAFGEIPVGHDLHHAVCGNTRCCHPEHVTPLTSAEHGRLSANVVALAARTHCAEGHPFAGDNLIVYKDGSRACRTCKRARGQARWREKHPVVQKRRTLKPIILPPAG